MDSRDLPNIFEVGVILQIYLSYNDSVTHLAFNCSKLTIGTVEQCLKYVQIYVKICLRRNVLSRQFHVQSFQ